MSQEIYKDDEDKAFARVEVLNDQPCRVCSFRCIDSSCAGAQEALGRCEGHPLYHYAFVPPGAADFSDGLASHTVSDVMSYVREALELKQTKMSSLSFKSPISTYDIEFGLGFRGNSRQGFSEVPVVTMKAREPDSGKIVAEICVSKNLPMAVQAFRFLIQDIF